MNQIGMWLQALYRVLSQEKDVFFNLVKCQKGLRTQLVQIHLPNTGDLKKVLNAGESIAMAMNVEHVRVTRDRGLVNIDIPLPESEWRIIPLSRILSKKGKSLTIGYDSTGQPTKINLSNPLCANILFAGMPGSGKTFSMISLAFQCAIKYSPKELQMAIIDLKNDMAWHPLHMLPHLVHPAVKTFNEAQRVLEWVREQRLERIDQSGKREFPRLVVIIDEIASLIMEAGPSGPLAKLIGESTGQGRALGINLLLGTQQPNQKTMGTFTTADMHVRVVGKVVNADYAAHATGRPQTGAEHLCGKGDVLVFSGNTVKHVTTLYLDRKSLKQLPRKREPKPLLLPERIPERPSGIEPYGENVLKKTALALHWFFRHGKPPTANSLQNELLGAMDNSRMARDLAKGIIKHWPDEAEVFARKLIGRDGEE